MKEIIDITFDIEATHLLGEDAIDYTASPYRLKEDFKIHCIVVEEHDTGKLIAFYDGPEYILDGRRYEESDDKYTYVLEDYAPVEYEKRDLKKFPKYIKKKNIRKAIAHNGINYDWLVCKLYFGMDYEVEPDKWCGKDIELVDTMVLSKTLNPDRFCGHSLEKLAQLTNKKEQKVAFRKDVPVEDRFKTFAADMLYYNIFDSKSNTNVYKYLEFEKGDWDWSKAISLEKAVAEIITRQSHRGFRFDKELAESNVRELDILMEERRLRVEPLLPPRPATKKFLAEHTPTKASLQVKEEEIHAPKSQFLKSGGISKKLQEFLDKHGGKDLGNKKVEIYGVEYDLPIPETTVIKVEKSLYSHFENWLKKHGGKVNKELTQVELYGKMYTLPLEQAPLKTEMVATIDDTTHIKNWLVGLGWNPTEYKEKDITLKSGPGKAKRTEEEMVVAVDRYVEETLASNFAGDRMEHLQVNVRNFRQRLLRHAQKRSCKVLTNPSFTVGQDKEMCRDLERIAEQFPYAKDIVEYLTYKHRRNSILGGGLDWEDGEEEAEKGYIANLREDGRIATPADTCGAATSRMKHKEVANVPRITTLYGDKMRALFGVDPEEYVQIGYDFSSLEARIEAHYCWRYEKGEKDYCQSLLLEKPNDVHTKTAQKISAIIGREFGRAPAKNVKYGCLPTDNSEVLTKEGWKYYDELFVGQDVLTYSTDLCAYEWKPIEKLWFYQDAEVVSMTNKWVSLESTEDHRWYGYKRRMKGSGKTAFRFNEKGFYTTAQINSEVGIRHAAHYWNENSKITENSAALIAWLLSDGYYKWSESDRERQGVVGSISQDDKKYNKELLRVIEDSFIEFTHDKEGSFNTYRLKSEHLRNFLDAVVGCRKQKHEVDWVSWILKLDQPALQSFLHHFWLADGHEGKTESFHITQNKGNIADAVMLAGNLTGHKVTFNYKTDKCLVINFSKKMFTTGQRMQKRFSRKTNVFCLTNTNETFVTRQDGFITLTGNCTYGAQAAKVAKTIGSDARTGEIVFEAFWEAALPLKRLKEALAAYWKSVGGKKFIKGIDGRKVPTRAEHAILNSLFQSGGVICAKKTMVEHDRLLKAEGLSVDFFRDDWRNKSYCQQLIAYHDEAQLEETKTNFKFKKFGSKEEANEFANSQDKVWSEAFEAKESWFVGYSRAAELISVAVDATTEYYNLNVPLHAGYILGINWRDCH